MRESGAKQGGSEVGIESLQPALQRPADTDVVGAVEPFIESAARGPANRVGPQQLDLLRALADAGGALPVATLVRRHRGAVSVARASTSRSLRRLWRAGLVELFDKRGNRIDVPRHDYVTRVAITAAGVEAVNGAMNVNHCEVVL
jgi:DNA-binding MarR family transcriptional regulator